MNITFPIPPNFLGFPERDMPLVEYEKDGETKQAKWTGRIQSNGKLEMLTGYSFQGTGLTCEIELHSIVRVIS